MESTVLPRDHFRASLLLVLGESPTYGYDLPTLLAPLGMGDADRGFVYRTLRSMEGDGLVASAWDSSSIGPARRIYSVTPAGTEWAVAASVTLREAERHMAGWEARYRRLLRTGGPRVVASVPAAS